MNNRTFYGIALMILASAVLFIGYKISNQSGMPWSHKSGKTMLQDSISINGVTKLSSECNCDVELIYSDDERVVFSYDKSNYENKSAVSGNSLALNFDNKNNHFFSWNEGSSIQVKVYSHSLNVIEQNGIGSIDSRNEISSENLEINNDGIGSMTLNVKANTLSIANSGVGSIEIKGDAQQATISNDGTGSIEAFNLNTKTAIVTNDGVGSVEINASDTLNMSNDGVGSITYSGNAYISKMNSDGVGSIDKK